MKYIQYSVTLLEPMKLAGQGTQQGTVITRKFIQGSAIRGAIIGEFCRRYPNLAIDDTVALREEFLTKTKFYNAYIKQGNLNTLPIPFIFQTTKEENRRKDRTRIYNSLMDEQEEHGEIIFGKGEFGNMDEGVLKQVSIKKKENLHIQKSEEKGIENKMFRYQAMDRGQVFQGYIQCEDRWEEDFKNLMEKNVFYIGGSKGSGYGKCLITFEMELSYEDFVKELPVHREERSKYLTIYAISDLVLYDSLGMVTNHIDCRYLEQALGIDNLEFYKSYCDTSMTSGYNQKWRTHAVQQTAVQAGSVLVYKYIDDSGKMKLDPEKIAELETKGVGLRREEGFGQIFVNPKWNQKEAIRAVEYIQNQENDKSLGHEHSYNQQEFDQLFQKMHGDEQTFVMNTIHAIREKRNYDEIKYQLVPKKYREMGERNWRISKTQARTLEKLLENIYTNRATSSYSQGKHMIYTYFSKQKNLTSFEATMLNKSETNPISLKDFISDLAKGRAALDRIEENWKMKDKTEEDRFYECCFYLMELLAYHARREED